MARKREPDLHCHHHHLRRILAIAASILFASCGKSGQGPVDVSPLVEAIYVNDCQTLQAYFGEETDPEYITAAPDDWTIRSFCYAPGGRPLYLVMYGPDEDPEQFRTSLVRLEPDGSTTDLYSFATCTDCEGAGTLGDIFLSPDGRYLAINTIGYENSDVGLFDLMLEEFVHFEPDHGADYLHFLAWDPENDGFIATSLYFLYEYSITDRTWQQLPTPNVRDYLTETELLQQGYLGSRVDYQYLIGQERPTIVGWNPSGWHFAFEQSDDLYLFNIADSTTKLLQRGDFDCQHSQHYAVTWGPIPAEETEPPDFGNRDLIVAFDSTILETITPLNDNITYEVGIEGSVSYLRPSWHGTLASHDYIFRDSISEEKFHVAEMNYLFWIFATELTPSFWSVTSQYAKDPSITDEAFAAEYQFRVDQYHDALAMFRAFRYPESLIGKKSEYDELVTLDYRHETAIAAYFANRNRAALADSLHLLRPDADSARIDNLLTELDEFERGNRGKIPLIVSELKFRYFNYYATMALDLDQLLNDLLIDYFYPYGPVAIPGDGNRPLKSENAWEFSGSYRGRLDPTKARY
jgi:hypothetical protein